jgi:hypothetical protein
MTGVVVLRRFGLWLGLLACLAGAAPRPAFAQTGAGIAGQLLDRATRQPLEGAAVSVLGTPVKLRSSATGQFTSAGFKPGIYVVQVRATLSVVIELEPTPIDLPGVTVEARAWERRGMAGFTARRERGRGVYLNEDDIKRSNAARLSDVLRSVSGVRVICRFDRCRVRMARGECQPDFVLDGFPANNSTSLEMPVVGIIAVEVYRTITETPVEFLRSANTCGAIVIWTRSGL